MWHDMVIGKLWFKDTYNNTIQDEYKRERNLD